MKTREEIEAMSDADRRIKTAELCGWKAAGEFSGTKVWEIPNFMFPTTASVETLPDYLNSLDAMAEIERWLDDTTGHMSVRCHIRDYLLNLMQICLPDPHKKLWENGDFLGTWGDCVFAYTATARQRNTAFLMTLL